jgi:hypothetical protein
MARRLAEAAFVAFAASLALAGCSVNLGLAPASSGCDIGGPCDAAEGVDAGVDATSELDARAPDAPAPDAPAPDAPAPDASSNDSGFGPVGWTACIAQGGDVYNCNIYCQSISKACVPACASGTYTDLSVASWGPGDMCVGIAEGSVEGVAGCSFQFTDTAEYSPRPVRWACCCR